MFHSRPFLLKKVNSFSVYKRKLSFWRRFKKSLGPDPPCYPVINPLLSDSVEFDIDQLVPQHIQRPDYSPELVPKAPVIWSKEEVERIRSSCQLASKLVLKSRDLLVPGATTQEINDCLHAEIVKRDAYPSTLGFRGFPRSVSTSVNNVAAHGVPDDRLLEKGDLVSIDVTVFRDGFHGDCAATFFVGHQATDESARHLVTAAKECLYRGVSSCGPGVAMTEIGYQISRLARKRHLAVIPNLAGHGIGSFFHGPPDVYHAANNYPGIMRPGMIFTIEPCISEGAHFVRVLPDNLTVISADNARFAQFEHTVLVTEYGVEILTA